MNDNQIQRNILKKFEKFGEYPIVSKFDEIPTDENDYFRIDLPNCEDQTTYNYQIKQY